MSEIYYLMCGAQRPGWLFVVDAGTIKILPTLPKPLTGLLELALDLRWASDPEVSELWPDVDRRAWERSGNPLTVLQCISEPRLAELASDRVLVKRLRRKLEERTAQLQSPGWFCDHYQEGFLTGIAYLCMEFGLGEAFPMYAGGLGVLAGDYLKACSDLDVPVTGIGLLYQRGYFRQALSALGSQVEIYPFSDPTQMPILPVRDRRGGWLNITVELPQGEVVLRVWEATVGRVKVFLLDTNHPLNRAADRGLAGELYGSGTETRLQQEILLGIGGCRLLRQLEIRPQIFHINEGHAAFAALERARLFMLDHDIGIREALRAVRPGNLFTTHTPVEAGFDRFPPGLIRQYLGSYVAGLGMELDEFLALGRVDAGNANEPFNMAYLALRTCGAANAVSRLHTVVSKRLFAPVFPGTPLPDVPVEGVTNAVHVPSWLSPDSHRFWSERLGSGCWSTPRADDRDAARAEGGRRSESGPATASGGVLLGSDEELWSLRCHNRERLVEAVRTHIAGRHGDPWRPCKEGQRPIDLLDPAFLTLGFARRFAGYKRCTLLLRDPDRLARILSDEHRPVQLIVAGKAHPSDNEGKEMIHAWAQFSRREDVLRRVAFLVDYDMALARAVVQGVDVWINNPRRPLEASGTSGMKVVANGGLNLSELDGWWAEAYSPERGWPIGDTIPEDIDCVTIDELEADQLYSRLEEHVIPLFYERDSRGIPEGWLRMMRGSMEGLAFRFSADRMVADYVDRFYAPGALACEERMAGQADLAVDLERWCDKVRRLLPGVVASHVVAADEDGLRRFEVAVLPYDLKEEFVSGSLAVEMYAEPEGTILEPPLLVPLRLKAEDEDTLLFVGELRSDRPSGHFTARVRPAHAQAFGGLEMPSPHWLHTPTAG